MVAGAHLIVIEMARAGASIEVIASQVKIPLSAIAIILRSPLAQAEIARRES